MSLKTFVKIGKIDNLSDARYCAGMMVDILGFNLEEGTQGYISPENFKEITEWVAGVQFAGEFSQALPAEIKLATTQYPLDYIEIQNVDHLEELQELSIPMILKIHVKTSADMANLAATLTYASELADYIIIDCDLPELYGQIETQLNEIKKLPRLIRSYGLNESTIMSIESDSIFMGIALEGSTEERPGFKDYGKVMDILEALEEEV